ncbi:MAG: hypothetical protein ACJ781_14430, partial [Myxococcales bacterium]
MALLTGCAFPDVQVRKRAATDFRCPEEDVWVESLGWTGYVAHGCRQEAEYSVGDGRGLLPHRHRAVGRAPPPEGVSSSSAAPAMRAALLAAGVALLTGCAFPDVQVRKRAATEFRCPEEDVWVESLGW